MKGPPPLPPQASPPPPEMKRTEPKRHLEVRTPITGSDDLLAVNSVGRLNLRDIFKNSRHLKRVRKTSLPDANPQPPHSPPPRTPCEQ